ncbi:MAG TPA: hypothetical protein VFI47_06180, partial [Acidimicrobiales bacterium]|nr:hypothetical protein [Acidimicrobiales bacterium]
MPTGTDRPERWWLAAGDPAALLARLDEALDLAAGGTGDPGAPGAVRLGDGPARLGLVDPDERKIRLARRL